MEWVNAQLLNRTVLQNKNGFCLTKISLIIQSLRQNTIFFYIIAKKFILFRSAQQFGAYPTG